MSKFEKFCQSCGMPLDKDPGNVGTNTDGTKNLAYCSYCFKDGKFMDNFTKSSEMVDVVKGKLKEMGVGPLRRWFYTSHISQLSRWKTR